MIAVSDPTDAVDAAVFDIEGTALSIGIEPSNGKVKLTAQHAGETVESGTYAHSVFSEPGERNKFLSSVETSLEDRQSVDAAGARTKLKEYLAEFGDLAEEEKERFREITLADEINEILEGTEYPVEVYRGEPTTWKVTLTFRGETRVLEFTTSEMNGSGAALEEKIANHFLEFLDIGTAEWEEVRADWVGNKRVVDTGGETATDAVADRVLEYLSDGVLAVADRDKLANSPSNAWFDENNSVAYSNAPPDASIVWVQARFLADKLEGAGKTVEYKGQLVKDLISRGDLYGKNTRRRWADGQRRRYYPFTPDALRVDPEQIGEFEDATATDEVEA